MNTLKKISPILAGLLIFVWAESLMRLWTAGINKEPQMLLGITCLAAFGLMLWLKKISPNMGIEAITAAIAVTLISGFHFWQEGLMILAVGATYLLAKNKSGVFGTKIITACVAAAALGGFWGHHFPHSMYMHEQFRGTVFFASMLHSNALIMLVLYLTALLGKTVKAEVAEDASATDRAVLKAGNLVKNSINMFKIMFVSSISGGLAFYLGKMIADNTYVLHMP